MSPFHLKEADAQGVMDYLSSLTSLIYQISKILKPTLTQLNLT